MSIQTGDLENLLMPQMTTGQFSEYTKKVERETIDWVFETLRDVLKDKTSPQLIDAIIEDLKVQIFDY